MPHQWCQTPKVAISANALVHRCDPLVTDGRFAGDGQPGIPVPGPWPDRVQGGHVRGMTDDMTIGERVAFYRKRRGLSQEVLAGLVGKTAEWLRKVENNRAELDRLSIIRTITTALEHLARRSHRRAEPLRFVRGIRPTDKSRPCALCYATIGTSARSSRVATTWIRRRSTNWRARSPSCGIPTSNRDTAPLPADCPTHPRLPDREPRLRQRRWPTSKRPDRIRPSRRHPLPYQAR